MPTPAFTDLLDQLKEEQNAHKVVSLLHLMLHMDVVERSDGGEQAPPPVCVQSEELLEQKAAVKKLSEAAERRHKDVSAQLRELQSKYRLISELNKRLYVKSKGLEAAHEKLCQQRQAAQEEAEQQRSLILELQRRLGGLEAAGGQQDGLAASQEAVRLEVEELRLQAKVAKEEMKEQRGLLLELRRRLDGLEAALEAPRRSPAGEEKGKRSKAAREAAGRRAAAAHGKEQRKPEPRKKSGKEKAATCSQPEAADGGARRARDAAAAAARGPSHRAGPDKRAARPRITVDARPNLKEAKPAKAPLPPPPLPSEKKDAKLPPIHKDRPAPVPRARPKETPLPGRVCCSRGGTSLTSAVQTSREAALRTPVQGLQDPAKARLPKLPPLAAKTPFAHKFACAKAPGEAAPESVEGRETERERSPLFPVANVDFHRDEDFSPWEHERLGQFSNDDGRDDE